MFDFIAEFLYIIIAIIYYYFSATVISKTTFCVSYYMIYLDFMFHHSVLTFSVISSHNLTFALL